MNTLLEAIGKEFTPVFRELGYDESFARVTVSNRPDLCEFQCNAAMALAKIQKKKPIDIANEIVEKLGNNRAFDNITALMPGFININISKEFLNSYIQKMAEAESLGIKKENPPKKMIIDYGGPNVAKPLHIGHLRSAIIGESLKRIIKYFGNDIIGDIHLGDWGLQMGLIIEELRERQPKLVYFDENFDGEYPKEAPFSISELEEIYPAASAKSKEDEKFKERAKEATLKLQSGYAPFRALWKHILNISIEDLKKNYDNLDVHFELWKGESDAQPYIPALIQELIDKGLAYESEGALVVDIVKDSDTKELPPCVVRKSDGAALYATSDLGTMIEREKLYNPDEYVYIADKRQELHYTQIFRVSKKAGIIPENKILKYIGFGTMNGKDGKPFKTRDGGVMRLEVLIADIEEAVFKKIIENRDIEEEKARETAKIVALAALKYGDLSNQALKDYIFDIDKFISFEGNTGPYILYTIVRIKSILNKFYKENSTEVRYSELKLAALKAEKNLELELCRFNEVMKLAYDELAPHKICQYAYGVANAFNSFYHEVKILSEEDENKKRSYIALISLTKNILNECIDLLGMKAPESM